MELTQHMNRKLSWILGACLLPGPVFALGLGKLIVDSALNEPLEARIELLSPKRDELDSLNVGLADSDAFERAGVERQFVLSGLKFELQESEVGADYIRVYSRDPIREPFLNFLVDINWSKGRLVREYTVLLDPPLYEPGARAPVVRAAPSEAAAGPMEAAEPAAAAEAPAEPTFVPYSGGDYGPTEANDTLWSIAGRMRPNASISIQQMMLALFRTNPEAFINGNINGLRRGHVLRMPPEAELSAMTREQAFAEAQSHHAAWSPGETAPVAAPQVAPAPKEPAPAATAAAPAVAPAAGEAHPELRLVAPDKSGGGEPVAGTAGDTAGAGIDLANEQLAALTQENVDLKERLAEAETIIEDLKRLIALKDDELAALQSKVIGAEGAAKPAPAAAPREAKPPATPAPQPAPEGTAPPAPAPAPAAAEKAPAPPAEPEAARPAPQPAPEKQKAAPAKPESVPPPVAGILERATGWVMGNLVLIGAAVGAIFVVVIGLVFLSRRKQAESVAAEDAAAAVQFPDFAGSEEETILPGAAAVEAAPEIRERAAPRKVEAPAAAAEEKTQFVTPAGAAPAAAPAAAAPPQEDPLAEVNVFLAYEHFDQAEEFVRDAIKREPDNLDFHGKLLEVFYAAGNRRKYEEAAKVLHGKVGGSGPHWDMALAMWQEMSPNRALFSAPSAEEAQAPAEAAAGGGVLDLTAKEKKAQAEEAGLDFDLGEMTAQPAAAAGGESGVEDVLDVTAAVGLGSDEELLAASAGAAESEDVLDLTGGEAVEEALSEPAAAGAGEDLLDVTAHADLEGSGLDADPLDVTVQAPPGAGRQAEEEPVVAAGPEAPAAVDLDLSLEPAGAPAADDHVLEFEPGLAAEASGSPGAGGEMDLDLSAASDTEGGLELSLDAPESESDERGLSLEAPVSDADGLELSLDAGEPADAGEAAGELDLSLEAVSAEEGDQTLFVPRTGDAQEQSAEDEIASKLDLAKAFVELGDKESARGILDEIAMAGNEQQRRQVQELLQQVR
jgi:pilus assembly protein FimV